MEWSIALIQFWIEHYYQLRDYELNPFEEIRIFMGDVFTSGSMPHLAPYEETCEMNWEFDKALKGLGDKKDMFEQLYLAGEGENKNLFDEFCRTLMENDAKP